MYAIKGHKLTKKGKSHDLFWCLTYLSHINTFWFGNFWQSVSISCPKFSVWVARLWQESLDLRVTPVILSNIFSMFRMHRTYFSRCNIFVEEGMEKKLSKPNLVDNVKVPIKSILFLKDVPIQSPLQVLQCNIEIEIGASTWSVGIWVTSMLGQELVIFVLLRIFLRTQE